eukprot:6213024-Pleurochrysis_carterae.AAC.14
MRALCEAAVEWERCAWRLCFMLVISRARRGWSGAPRAARRQTAPVPTRPTRPSPFRSTRQRIRTCPTAWRTGSTRAAIGGTTAATTVAAGEPRRTTTLRRAGAPCHSRLARAGLSAAPTLTRRALMSRARRAPTLRASAPTTAMTVATSSRRKIRARTTRPTTIPRRSGPKPASATPTMPPATTHGAEAAPTFLSRPMRLHDARSCKSHCQSTSTVLNLICVLSPCTLYL